MSNRILSLVFTLLALGIGGSIVLYREVGVLRDAVFNIQKDVDLRDKRERDLQILVTRIDERVKLCRAPQ